MDGSVKGMINVDESSNAKSRDERSRSTWAQVVSGGQHEEEPRPSDRKHENNQNQSNHEVDQEEINDGWETVDKKTTKRKHKIKKDHWNGYKQPTHEQKYSDEVHHSINTYPTNDELSDFSTACNKLWELDLNRLIPTKDYQIDCGNGKKAYERGDMAESNLYTWISEDVFKKPTFSRFCSLLDNYNPHQGVKEVVTSEHIHEQHAFIEEISRTAPIKYLHNYLSKKGVVSENFEEFKKMMANLWFDLYGRGGTSGCSSAFEHVFVGEIKDREHEVSGFHNWIQPDSETQLLTIQFEWNGVLKHVSSTLVGVSPEFEVALYTLCFFVGQEENHIKLGPYSVNVKCYRLRNKIGSVFLVAE